MLFPQDPRLAVETPWEQWAQPRGPARRASRKRDKKSTSPLPGSLKYSIKPRPENNQIQQVEIYPLIIWWGLMGFLMEWNGIRIHLMGYTLW